MGKSIVLEFKIENKFSKYLIPKASILINGVSLTISKIKGNNFQIWCIPHTLKLTNLNNLKINDLEYEQNKDFFETPGNHHILKKTIITKGRNGCEFQGKIYSTDDVPVKDISGAGDTFLAGLTKEYVKTKNIFSAISFAQDCTKIVVQKHGVSTI